MVSQNIHGIVITEHNTLWPADRIELLNRRLPDNFRIYSGIEVSTVHHHVVVIGMHDSAGIHPGIPIETLLDLTREKGAAAILVHPFSANGGMHFLDPFPGFDGIEVVSTMTFGDKVDLACSLCAQHKVAAVGGSDAHCSQNVGKAFTVFPSLPEDEEELAGWIKKGQGMPMSVTQGGKGVRVC
jgi:predicted metal-dependent phosphoesterase TrpH